MAGPGTFPLKPHLGLAVSMAALLAACSGSTSGPGAGNAIAPPGSRINRPAFTEAEYGVSTSPRVTAHRGTLRKGGGTFKLGRPYKVAGRWYVPREDPNYDSTGIGSWYGDDFHGRKTANGELFDMHALTAAHPTLPMPSYAYVTNLDNGRTILVRINDRGPYVAGRIIDLSHTSASALGYAGQGRARVRVRYAGRAPLNGDDRRERQHIAQQSWYRGRMSVASAPASAPVSLPEPFPAGTAGRWSPAAYRAQVAGKSLPPAFAHLQEGRMAVTRGESRPDWPIAQVRDDDGRPPAAPALVWQATPRAPERMETGAVSQTGHGYGANAAGNAYVQVGTFKERARAEQLRADLGHMGPVEVASIGAGAEPQYRVRIGPMAPSVAESTLAHVKASGIAGGSIVVD